MLKKTDPRLVLFALFVLIVFIPLSRSQAGTSSSAGASGQSQWVALGSVPDGLEAEESYRFLELFPADYEEIAILHASDAQTVDYFGVSVAISGDTLVVGAYLQDGNPGDPLPDSGAAYIFERDLGGANYWGEVIKLTASDAQASDYFGRAVALSGDTLVVGAYGGGDAGAVYVFERDFGGIGGWGEAARLTASDAQGGDQFGISVAIIGDTLVVGAPNEDGGPGKPIIGAGAVYIFERNLGGAGNWGEAAKLTASDAQAFDLFGGSLAVSVDTIVVGAIQEDGGPGDPYPYAGAVYVFERNLGGTGSWGEAVILHASDAQASGYFGASVATSGDTLVVGAYGEDGNPRNPLPWAGAVYVFERDLGNMDTWMEAARLTASDAQEHDLFGYSVVISGDTLVIGAFGEDGGSGGPLPEVGAAYVFERDLRGPGNWRQAAVLYASDGQQWDSFGESVALGEDTLVIGAIFEAGGPGDPLPAAGAVYVFQAVQSDPTPMPTTTPTPRPTRTPFGDGTVTPTSTTPPRGTATVTPMSTPRPTRTPLLFMPEWLWPMVDGD